jgi:hypothetical protein
MPNARIQGLEGSGHWVAVTPSDTTDLTTVTRGIYVGVAGNITVDSADGDTTILFTAIAIGMIHALKVKRVRATGTSASGIVAIY